MKLYILVYSHISFGNRDFVSGWISENSELIKGWRYDLPNSIYFHSDKSANDLARSLKEYKVKKNIDSNIGRFLITEIIQNRQGHLPRETWDFFKKYSKE